MNEKAALHVRESLHGTFYLASAPREDRAIRFSFEIEVRHWRDFAKNVRCDVEGVIEAEGFAERAPLRGTVRFDLARERRLPYTLAFTSDDGRRIQLVGQKEWVPAAPLESFFQMQARFFDEAGVEVGRATLQPESRHPVLSLVSSLRLRPLGGAH